MTISRGIGNPDGVPVEMILINGQFPGPMIEANWGDHIEVTVHNNITGPEEGTSLHWHGLLQKETPWMDGVPSISQCPIAPGATFKCVFHSNKMRGGADTRLGIDSGQMSLVLDGITPITLHNTSLVPQAPW